MLQAVAVDARLSDVPDAVVVADDSLRRSLAVAVAMAVPENAAQNPELMPEAQVLRFGEGCKRGCRNSPHLKSVVLTAGFVVFGVLAVLQKLDKTDMDWMDDGDMPWWPCAAVCYALYWLKVLCSSTWSYLRNIHSSDFAISHVQRLKSAPPLISWHVRCYHYETVTHTTTDADGHASTYTSEERFDSSAWRMVY